MKLVWTSGEGFELQSKRDLTAEIEQLGDWMTADEVVESVGAEAGEVRIILQKSFEMRTGEEARALGRSPKAKLYGCGVGTRLTPQTSADESSSRGRRSPTRLLVCP
jgi:hypothetical protein